MNPIVKILMQRDEISEAEAVNLLLSARERIAAGDDPADVLEEEFGLEPDYLYDLLD